MKPQLTRRRALALLGAGAMIGFPARMRAASGAGRLSPPQAPMLFRRRVLRELVDGAAIVAERGFEVRFLPAVRGYRVEGAQVSVAVETPPELARLAEIERKRVETGMFPVELDATGLLLDGAGPEARPTPALDAAIDAAIATLHERGADDATLADANGFFLWLQQAAGAIGADPPRELFVPPAEPQQIIRAVDLPGGGSGGIVIAFQGTISPETGLMRTAERTIITSTEGSSLRTVENWSLESA